MSKHRNPRAKVPKRPPPYNLATSILIRRLYDALVELEALAVTADEAVTMLPAGPWHPAGSSGRQIPGSRKRIAQTAPRALLDHVGRLAR
jgi:hypothetical protein